jgi:hypothetical protein
LDDPVLDAAMFHARSLFNPVNISAYDLRLCKYGRQGRPQLAASSNRTIATALARPRQPPSRRCASAGKAAREGWGIIRTMSGAGATEKPLGPTRAAPTRPVGCLSQNRQISALV